MSTNAGWVRDSQPAGDCQDGGGGQGLWQHVPAAAGQLGRDQRGPTHLPTQVQESGFSLADSLILYSVVEPVCFFPGSGNFFADPGSKKN